MTYQESDFPGLLNRIGEIIDTEEDPAVATELIGEIIDTYQQIPLYPGIVTGVSYDLIESVDAGELEIGDRIAFEDGDSRIAGTIRSIEDGNIKLEAVSKCTDSDQQTLALDNVDEIHRLTPGALEREWPELIFEENGGQ